MNQRQKLGLAERRRYVRLWVNDAKTDHLALLIRGVEEWLSLLNIRC